MYANLHDFQIFRQYFSIKTVLLEMIRSTDFILQHQLLISINESVLCRKVSLAYHA